MSIIPKETIIKQLEDYFHVKLQQVKCKQIIYEGMLSNNMRMVVCTPKSKMYPRGFGWVDLTTVQLEAFDKYTYQILAIRMEGGSLYYLHVQTLTPYLTIESRKYNTREGNHWKLYLYPDHIRITGNKELYMIEPNNLNNL